MIERIKNILNDKDFEEILKKSFSFLIIRAGGLIAGYVFTYLIARNYGASVNGLIALSFTLLFCISIFGRLGLDINLVRFYSLDKNRNDKGLFFKVVLLAVLFSSLLAFLLFTFKDLFIYKIFNKPKLEPYIFWVSLTIPLWSIILVCGGLFRAKKQNIWFAFLDSPGRFLLSLTAFIILLLFSNDFLTPIKAHFLGVLLLAIIGLILSIKNLNSITFKTDNSTLVFLKESYPMMISGAVLVFLGWADTFVLGIYESDSVIGVYNVTLKIAALTSFSLHSLNSILAPKIAKSYQNGDILGYKKIISFSTKLNFFITLFITFLIIYFQEHILGVFGEEFLSGSKILIILCLGQLINSLSGSVGVILQMTGQQIVYQKIVLIALAINVVLNFTLTPIYGAIAAAISTVISISFWNISGAIYLKRKLDIVSYFSLNQKND